MDAVLHELKRQNRLLKAALGIAGVGLVAALTMAAKTQDPAAKFSVIDVERINVRNADGGLAVVLSSKERLPRAVIDGKEVGGDRNKPGLIFFAPNGDEVGGLVYDSKTDANGRVSHGVHLSMDRKGGDQQLALAHTESGNDMFTGLNVFDRGLYSNYGPLADAMKAAPAGPEKDALRAKWKEAGGAQTQRVFVGRTPDKASAVVLADAGGRPRIMMLVTPEGTASLQFLDEKGNVVQTLPQAPAVAKQ